MADNDEHGRFGPEKIWPLIAAAVVVLVGWQYFQTQQPAGEKVAVLRANNPDGTPGGRVTRADCLAGKDRVWVSTDEFTECIAYVVAEAPAGAANTGTGLVFFNGDVPESRRADQAKPEVAANELQRARAAAREFGLPVVVMGRPGLMGSTGFHEPGGMREDAYVMTLALDAVREKLGLRRLAVAGQSGGARLIAQMMVLGRQDISCAAMGSGAYDLPERIDGSRARTNIFGNAQRRYLVPMLEAENIPRDANRRLFVIGDPNDGQAKFPEQRAWAEKLGGLGHVVTLIEAKGSGPKNHGTADAAIAAAGACARGDGDGAVKAAVQRTGRGT